MKIRTGFVSNSSSSSFCVFGVSIDEDYDTNKLDELIKGTDLKYFCPPDQDMWLGVEPWSMEMDETRKQFQERVEKLLQEVGFLNKGESATWHDDGWYEG